MIIQKYFKAILPSSSLTYPVVLCVVILLGTCSRIHGQVPDFSMVQNLNPGDSANITYLVHHGIKVCKGRVIAWFPKDSMSRKEMKTIADTLHRGIVAAGKFIKAPMDWQVHGKDKAYTFYFRLDSFISHASGSGFISIPFHRIKKGRAPWLHEAMHEMFNTKTGSWHHISVSEEDWAANMPLWLAEGLPEYVSLEVSRQLGFPRYDPFTDSFMTNMDSLCHEDLKGPKAREILPYIGSTGVVKEMFGSERRLFAATLYHCSCSFVKYLVEHAKLDPLIHGIASFKKEMEVLQNKLPVPIEQLKKQWLESIK